LGWCKTESDSWITVRTEATVSRWNGNGGKDTTSIGIAGIDGADVLVVTGNVGVLASKLGVAGIDGTVISIITIDGCESASLIRITNISGTFITIITWSNWNVRTGSIIYITNSSVASIDWWTIDWIEVAVVVASRGGTTIVSAKIIISANDWLNDAISRGANTRIASIRLSALELSKVAYVVG